jgi:hypothetical protein
VSIFLIDFTVSSRGDERERRGSKSITFQGAIMTSHGTRASGYRRGRRLVMRKLGAFLVSGSDTSGPTLARKTLQGRKNMHHWCYCQSAWSKGPSICFFLVDEQTFSPFSKNLFKLAFVLLLAGVRCTVHRGVTSLGS